MELKKELLMVFIKNPVTGKVKTRLAAAIGDSGAFAVYKKLLEHTLEISMHVNVEKIIFYSDFIPANDAWIKKGFRPQLQQGAGLGEKMKNAFQHAFENKFSKVIIIGSDCLELTTDLIKEAFIQLDKSDVVIGPAADGGYYLLGMKKLHNDLFDSKTWGSASVYNDTMRDIYRLQLSAFNLPVLNDIDAEKDLPTGLKFIAGL